mgnify:CR=1 FL=1
MSCFLPPFSLSMFPISTLSSQHLQETPPLQVLWRIRSKFFTSQCGQFHCSILQLSSNRLYYTLIRQKRQHITFSVILSVHCKYWLHLSCDYMFFLYFLRYYSFIAAYSIRYDKTLLYIFMSRCEDILSLFVLSAFEPNPILLRFHLKYS